MDTKLLCQWMLMGLPEGRSWYERQVKVRYGYHYISADRDGLWLWSERATEVSDQTASLFRKICCVLSIKPYTLTLSYHRSFYQDSFL